MIKKITLFLLLHSILFFLNSPSGKAQESLIQTILSVKKSCVAIQAFTIAAQAINPTLARTPNGRLILGQRVTKTAQEKQGAGIIIREDGLIVTNFHTIYQMSHIIVQFANQQKLPAEIIHLDPQNDLAILKTNPPFPIIPIILADSNLVTLNDEVINIGYSDLLEGTLLSGTVTATLNQKNNQMPQPDFFVVNIPLTKGDSGGPLLNKKGELIGMVSAQSRQHQRATFAIVSNKIKKLYWDFLK